MCPSTAQLQPIRRPKCFQTCDKFRTFSHTSESNIDIEKYPIRPGKSNHKVIWDMLTVFLSATVGTYTTHASIQNRCFAVYYLNEYCEARDWAPNDYPCFRIASALVQIWFILDILMNFTPIRRPVNDEKRRIIQSGSTSYFKTWFFVDIFSILPWERVLVHPIFELRRQRNPWQQSIILVRQSPKLFKNFRRFFRVWRTARSIGWKTGWLVRHAPTYTLFFSKMKVVLLIRALREIRWITRALKHVFP